MRTFLVALAIFGTFATAVRAADDGSPLVGKFPDTAGNLSVYLFKLKDNHISLAMSAQEFCTKMDYGEALLFNRPDEIGKDNKVGPGKLDWVICRFKGK
ncbi:hypothetical protein [Bradyrhizobium sp.]